MKDQNVQEKDIKIEDKDFLEQVKQRARKDYIPIVRDKTAEALAKVCKEKGPKRILEIGTAIGYSGIIMLKNCNGTLVTIEKDEERAKEAHDNFISAGLSARITQKIDDAQNVIKKLREQGEKFDLIFLDGPKGQYKNYYPFLKELLSGGGILFCDNVNLLGLVKQEGEIPHKHRSMVNHLREFIEQLKADKELQTTFYDIDDGFSISEKIL